MKTSKKLIDRLSHQLAGTVAAALPKNARETLKLRSFGLLQVPLLFFLSPSVVELNDYRCVVKIPLNRRSKNHLGSMYFGSLAAGADCAGGLIAWKLCEEASARGKKVALIFKDFKAEFLKRAEGDVLFTCEDGMAIRALAEQVVLSGERGNLPVHITATVPSKFGQEPVARFTLTLSLK
jgi:acyl-coenzyme A thioesterase PaaI-like protein